MSRSFQTEHHTRLQLQRPWQLIQVIVLESTGHAPGHHDSLSSDVASIVRAEEGNSSSTLLRLAKPAGEGEGEGGGGGGEEGRRRRGVQQRFLQCRETLTDLPIGMVFSNSAAIISFFQIWKQKTC